MPAGSRMKGKVVGKNGLYFEVDCPDAPAHLKPLFLVPWQMKGAQVGDSVVLEYQVSPSSGLWNVVEVMK